MECTRPDGRRWPLRRLASFVLPALVVITILSLAGPFWWRLTPDGGSLKQQGNDIEQRVVSRLTKVRDSEEPWGFVIEDDIANVWLATRLIPWLEHDGDLEFPDGWTDPRIRFGTDVIQIGIRSPWHSVVVIDLRPRLELESVVFELVGISIGWIPVPLAMGASMVPEFGTSDGHGPEVSMDGLSVPRTFDLADGRRVRIEDLEVASGELGLRFRTLR